MEAARWEAREKEDKQKLLTVWDSLEEECKTELNKIGFRSLHFWTAWVTGQTRPAVVEKLSSELQVREPIVAATYEKLLNASFPSARDNPPETIEKLYNEATFLEYPWPVGVLNSLWRAVARASSHLVPELETAPWDEFKERAKHVAPECSTQVVFSPLYNGHWSKRHTFLLTDMETIQERPWQWEYPGIVFLQTLRHIGKSQGFTLKQEAHSSSVTPTGSAANAMHAIAPGPGPTRPEGKRSTTRLASGSSTPPERSCTIADFTFEHVPRDPQTVPDSALKKIAVVELKTPATLGLNAPTSDRRDMPARERVEDALKGWVGVGDDDVYGALRQVMTQMLTHRAPCALLTDAATFVVLCLDRLEPEGSGGHTWKLQYYVGHLGDGVGSDDRPTTNQCIAYMLQHLRKSDIPHWCTSQEELPTQADASGGDMGPSPAYPPSPRHDEPGSTSGSGSGPGPAAPLFDMSSFSTSWPGEGVITLDPAVVGDKVGDGHYNDVYAYDQNCVLKLANDRLRSAREELINEMRMYHFAHSLQGDCLPRVVLAGFDSKHNCHAIVSERVGESAAKLPPERIAAAGARILAAYEKLWAHGVLHGDVALRNIALTHDGRVTILDLGRARPLALMDRSYLEQEQAAVARLLRKAAWRACRE